MTFLERKYHVIEERFKLKPLRDVILFALITISIHFLYRLWAITFDYYIFGFQVLPPSVHMFFVDILYNSSRLVMQLLSLPFDSDGYNFLIHNPEFPTHGDKYIFTIKVVSSCSGIKQFIQFALLMIIFPGPWKHKLWYIPMGLVLVYITNVLRIVGLSELVRFSPESFKWVHDYVFRPIFYVVIFSLWVIWVEYYKNNRKFHWKDTWIVKQFSKKKEN